MNGDSLPSPVEQQSIQETAFSRTVRKIVLLVGYASVVFAIVRAHTTPASGYELSLYHATPLSIWIALILAVGLGLFVAFTCASRWLFRGGLLLAGLAVVLVAALPVVRGYQFYGRHDSLTHLGWARELAAGELSPTGIIYPFSHQLAVVVSGFSGMPIPQSMHVVVVLTALLFVVFVPLCLRSLIRDRTAVLFGAFAGLLLLPINNLGMHMFFFPFTMATFYATAVLFFLIRYLGRVGEGLDALRSADGVLLLVSLPALVVLHPQVTLNVLVLLSTITAVRLALRWFDSEHPLAQYPPLALQTVLLGGLFFGWVTNFPQFSRAITQGLGSLVAITEPSSTAGQSIQSRGASLASIGGSIEQLAIKLFLVSFVFVLLSAGLLIWTVATDRRDSRSTEAGLIRYVAISGIPFGGLLLLNTFGTLSSTTYLFRYAGFLMIFATIFGAISLYRLFDATALRIRGRPLASGVLVVVVVFLLVLSLSTLFPSPYIYKSNQQITAGEMTGHRESFRYQGAGIQFTGIRASPTRYRDALTGSPDPDLIVHVPGPVLRRNVTSYYESDTYLPVTTADRRREVDVFRELRYRDETFAALNQTRNVHLVRSTSDFRLYYIEASIRNGSREQVESTESTRGE